MKIAYVTAIVAALTLSACGQPDAPTISSTVSVPAGPTGTFNVDIEVICLNGVKYWSGHKRLAPYVNPETLQFEKCSANKQF